MAVTRKAVRGAALALLGGLAGCATPARIMADIEIDRLCAKDGGIKVYERVALPANYFYPDIKGDPRSGDVNLQAMRADAAKLPHYYELVSNREYVPSKTDIRISRWGYTVVERPSGKVIAAGTNYVRSGGDFGNPFTPTVHSCIGSAGPFWSDLLVQVFYRAP